MSGRRARALLLASLGLAACHVHPPPPGPPAGADARASVRTRASASPGAAPVATAMPTPRASASGAPALLRTDTGKPLRGTVRLDAAYLLRLGTGRLVGPAESGTVVVGAAAPIGSGAENAIAPVKPSADGTRLIGPDGAGLIGPDGAGLIGPEGAGFRLLQTAPAAAALPPGTRLPAAGMLVAAVSLAGGKPVPLGLGPDGKPAWAVWTNAEGRFSLALPADVQGNVRLVALVAGTRDARQHYDVLVNPDRGGEREIHEDADDAADFLRLCFIGGMDALLRKQRGNLTVEMVLSPASLAGENGVKGLDRLHAAATAAGYTAMPPERQLALRRRLVDLVLAEVPLDEIAATTGELALPRLEAYLAYLHEVVAIRFRETGANEPGVDPATSGLWREPAAAADPALPGLLAEARREILRPADFNDFVVRRVLAEDPLNADRMIARLGYLREAMGLPPGVDDDRRLGQVTLPIATIVGATMFRPGTDDRMPLVEAAETIIAEFGRRTGP